MTRRPSLIGVDQSDRLAARRDWRRRIPAAVNVLGLLWLAGLAVSAL